ncbi:MAG: hypothetical protein ACI4JM_13350 [Oscillospiraceae bacterium]
MKRIQQNKAKERVSYLERTSHSNNNKNRIDYSTSEIGIKVTNGKVEIFALGTKFESAEYLAFKLDHLNAATEIGFNDFIFAADKINDYNFTALISLDGTDIKISPHNPYTLDMKLVFLFRTPEIIVQITLYNANNFACGLSGCYISIGIKGVNYINVWEGCAAMVSVINHQETQATLDILLDDPNIQAIDYYKKNN